MDEQLENYWRIKVIISRREEAKEKFEIFICNSILGLMDDDEVFLIEQHFIRLTRRELL